MSKPLATVRAYMPFGYEFYQHWKGGMYVKIGEATHSETGERLVIYHSLAGGSAQVYARPKAMFEEILDNGQPRFKRYVP